MDFLNDAVACQRRADVGPLAGQLGECRDDFSDRSLESLGNFFSGEHSCERWILMHCRAIEIADPDSRCELVEVSRETLALVAVTDEVADARLEGREQHREQSDSA